MERYNINFHDNNDNTKYAYSPVDLLEILATYVQHRFVQANGGSTNTTRVHVLLLPSKHY